MHQDRSAALWVPSQEFINQSNLKRFEKWLEEHQGLMFESYNELWNWSVNNPSDFWESVSNYFEVIHHTPYQSIISDGEMPDVEWFQGSTLNYAEHIFRQKSEDRPALIFCVEDDEPVNISWKELESKVAMVRAHLKQSGVGLGDRVVAYLPNIPEAIISFLAVNSLGAVWSCCSPDFGVNTVVDRFSQIEPKVLIATNGYQYNGKWFDRSTEIDEITNKIESLNETIILTNEKHPDSDCKVEYKNWSDIISKNVSAKLEFTSVPFSHPIWVLYSSGTTGKPKAITHSHGGTLLEHLKYLSFHNDVHPGENFFWFTTTGWMMWNFLQASMLVGATPVLYDGNPGYRGLDRLWKLAESLPIHHFGTSAPYLVANMKHEIKPGTDFKLNSLRSIGSTGSPLPEEAFEWVYQEVSESVWLCSMSGGTDVCTAFVGGSPYQPVYKGLIQSRTLGCGLKAYDDLGQEVIDEVGEMVIEQPMPSMPIYFWNDPESTRYKSSYFESYSGKWCHGDWIKVHEDGSLMILGRSDATLNRKGIRMGTAEIYAALDGIPELKDMVIVNLEKEKGGDVMPLFVALNEGISLTTELKAKINDTLKVECSPRHVPDLIIEVPDIPYTMSGKKIEVAIKKILMGMKVSENRSALRNPEALDFFINNVKSELKN